MMEQLTDSSGYFASILEDIKKTEDKRVADWFFMDSHSRVLLISLAYIVFCKYLGPRLMKDRKPFSLKRTILIYDIIQILLCTWFSFRVINDGTWVLTKLICDPAEFNVYKVIEVSYWNIFIKMLELIETVFFIMRKKQSQVTNLHLYHHATTFIFVWMGVKYKAGLGLTTFGMLNCLVHIMMYTYYTIAAVGSQDTKKIIKKYKKYITIVQMIQFTIMLTFIARYYIASCLESKVLAAIFFPNVIFVFYMFYEFYQASNNVKSKDK